MPKPLFFQTQQINQNVQDQEHRLSATLKPETTQNLRTNPTEVQRMLRRRRSPKYMQIMSKLDAGSTHISQKDIEEMIEAIREEFPDIDILNEYVGCMAVCHLGEPFEVHTMNVGEQRIVHFHANYEFESPLNKCRQLCLMPEYQFIEVYTNEFRAISANGAVANIPAPGAGDAWVREGQKPCEMIHGPCEGLL